MAVDTICSSSKLEAIADAIRAKAGISDPLTLDGMASEIEALSTGFDTSQMSSLASVFAASPLYSIDDLDLLDTSGATSMQRMFYQATRLREILTSTWDTSGVTNMKEMFRDCTNAGAINMGGNYGTSAWNTSNVTDMSYMFYSCSNLETLVGVQGFEVSTVKTFRQMFYNCPALHLFDDDVDGVLDLRTWDMRNAIDTSSSTYQMFYNCKKIKTLILGANSFIGVNMLPPPIDIWEDVPEFSFRNLVIDSDVPPTMQTTQIFANGGISTAWGIYVPDNAVSDYKAATNWSTFSNYIKPMSELVE